MVKNLGFFINNQIQLQNRLPFTAKVTMWDVSFAKNIIEKYSPWEFYDFDSADLIFLDSDKEKEEKNRLQEQVMLTLRLLLFYYNYTNKLERKSFSPDLGFEYETIICNQKLFATNIINQIEYRLEQIRIQDRNMHHTLSKYYIKNSHNEIKMPNASVVKAIVIQLQSMSDNTRNLNAKRNYFKKHNIILSIAAKPFYTLLHYTLKGNTIRYKKVLQNVAVKQQALWHKTIFSENDSEKVLKCFFIQNIKTEQHHLKSEEQNWMEREISTEIEKEESEKYEKESFAYIFRKDIWTKENVMQMLTIGTINEQKQLWGSLKEAYFETRQSFEKMSTEEVEEIFHRYHQSRVLSFVANNTDIEWNRMKEIVREKAATYHGSMETIKDEDEVKRTSVGMKTSLRETIWQMIKTGTLEEQKQVWNLIREVQFATQQTYENIAEIKLKKVFESYHQNRVLYFVEKSTDAEWDKLEEGIWEKAMLNHGNMNTTQESIEEENQNALHQVQRDLIIQNYKEKQFQKIEHIQDENQAQKKTIKKIVQDRQKEVWIENKDEKQKMSTDMKTLLRETIRQMIKTGTLEEQRQVWNLLREVQNETSQTYKNIPETELIKVFKSYHQNRVLYFIEKNTDKEWNRLEENIWEKSLLYNRNVGADRDSIVVKIQNKSAETRISLRETIRQMIKTGTLEEQRQVWNLLREVHVTTEQTYENIPEFKLKKVFEAYRQNRVLYFVENNTDAEWNKLEENIREKAVLHHGNEETDKDSIKEKIRNAFFQVQHDFAIQSLGEKQLQKTERIQDENQFQNKAIKQVDRKGIQDKSKVRQEEQRASVDTKTSLRETIRQMIKTGTMEEQRQVWNLLREVQIKTSQTYENIPEMELKKVFESYHQNRVLYFIGKNTETEWNKLEENIREKAVLHHGNEETDRESIEEKIRNAFLVQHNFVKQNYREKQLQKTEHVQDVNKVKNLTIEQHDRNIEIKNQTIKQVYRKGIQEKGIERQEEKEQHNQGIVHLDILKEARIESKSEEQKISTDTKTSLKKTIRQMIKTGTLEEQKQVWNLLREVQIETSQTYKNIPEMELKKVFESYHQNRVLYFIEKNTETEWNRLEENIWDKSVLNSRNVGTDRESIEVKIQNMLLQVRHNLVNKDYKEKQLKKTEHIQDVKQKNSAETSISLRETIRQMIKTGTLEEQRQVWNLLREVHVTTEQTYENIPEFKLKKVFEAYHQNRVLYFVENNTDAEWNKLEENIREKAILHHKNEETDRDSIKEKIRNAFFQVQHGFTIQNHGEKQLQKTGHIQDGNQFLNKTIKQVDRKRIQDKVKIRQEGQKIPVDAKTSLKKTIRRMIKTGSLEEQRQVWNLLREVQIETSQTYENISEMELKKVFESYHQDRVLYFIEKNTETEWNRLEENIWKKSVLYHKNVETSRESIEEKIQNVLLQVQHNLVNKGYKEKQLQKTEHIHDEKQKVSADTKTSLRETIRQMIKTGTLEEQRQVWNLLREVYVTTEQTYENISEIEQKKIFDTYRQNRVLYFIEKNTDTEWSKLEENIRKNQTIKRDVDERNQEITIEQVVRNEVQNQIIKQEDRKGIQDKATERQEQKETYNQTIDRQHEQKEAWIESKSKEQRTSVDTKRSLRETVMQMINTGTLEEQMSQHSQLKETVIEIQKENLITALQNRVRTIAAEHHFQIASNENALQTQGNSGGIIYNPVRSEILKRREIQYRKKQEREESPAIKEQQKEIKLLINKMEMQERLVSELQKKQSEALQKNTVQIEVNKITKEVMKQFQDQLWLEKMRRGLD